MISWNGLILSIFLHHRECFGRHVNFLKAYIVKIVFKDFNDPVWRRVILPAGGTFRRMHDTIQYVTNFQSGYGGDIHLYAFDLPEESLIITNDEMAYEKYQKSRKRKESVMWNIRTPSSIKIDKYLEKYKSLHYIYDYGDEWELNVLLEETVEDYYFGYPTLLDGYGDAPPEDLGGVGGFELFKMALADPSHPFHKDAVEYGHTKNFRSFNMEWINGMLKFISWKKTQWEKIEHVNYSVVRDKYRKP